MFDFIHNSTDKKVLIRVFSLAHTSIRLILHSFIFIFKHLIPSEFYYILDHCTCFTEQCLFTLIYRLKSIVAMTGPCCISTLTLISISETINNILYKHGIQIQSMMGYVVGCTEAEPFKSMLKAFMQTTLKCSNFAYYIIHKSMYCFVLL